MFLLLSFHGRLLNGFIASYVEVLPMFLRTLQSPSSGLIRRKEEVDRCNSHREERERRVLSNGKGPLS
jgi:hypothetical protein